MLLTQFTYTHLSINTIYIIYKVYPCIDFHYKYTISGAMQQCYAASPRGFFLHDEQDSKQDKVLK